MKLHELVFVTIVVVLLLGLHVSLQTGMPYLETLTGFANIAMDVAEEVLLSLV